jgi:hypothetical protein
MKKLSQNSSGVWVVGLVLAGLIIVMIVLVGLDVLRRNKTKSPSGTGNTSQNEQKGDEKPETKDDRQEIKLADDKVSFKVPKNWSNEGVGCTSSQSAYRHQEYEDSALLLPGEKLPIKYSEGTEFFTIPVCVFRNKDNLSAEKWYSDAELGIGAAAPTNRDTTSTESINGYDTYYHKQVTSDYQEVHYVLAAHDKLVYVKARIYEPGQLADKPIGDFRKFEPEIAALVKSLSISE